jgi:hypothetical protein
MPLLGMAAQAGVSAIDLSQDSGAVVKTIDLDLSQGPISDLCAQATGIAFKMFVVFGLIALIIEAFGPAPAERRDYSGLAWRAVLVLVLLKFYAPVFGTVINTTQAVAAEFKPMDANEELSRQTALYFANAQKTTDPGTSTTSSSNANQSWLGTKLYETTIHLIITLGQAVFWALGVLARIALLLFYVIGPLALVASLPRSSHVGTRWFGQYVGVACWPIFSAVIIRIVLAIGVSGMYAVSAMGHVCVALALGLCALAVPIIANALVGGSVTTAAQQGFRIAHAHVSGLTSSVVGSAKKAGPLVQAGAAGAARARDAIVDLHAPRSALDGEALRSILSHVRSGEAGAPPQNNPGGGS